MSRFPVNEIFETIQGEATFTGTPSIFIRMQGCPVGCPWCDTKHTWTVFPDQAVSIETMMGKTADGPQYAWMDDLDVVMALKKFTARHVVLTGGEPALYDLLPLTTMLDKNGFGCQIETSGTHEVRVSEATFVTVSPKIDMPGGFRVRADAVHRADEIKMPVGKQADLDILRRFLEQFGVQDKIVWLQPLSQSIKATELCVRAAIAENHRVSIQTHKYLGVR